MEEYTVEEIIKAQKRGQGWQFLVQWSGYEPEEDWWVTASSLDECKTVDWWYKSRGEGSAAR
jgi:hypothetical protein